MTAAFCITANFTVDVPFSSFAPSRRVRFAPIVLQKSSLRGCRIKIRNNRIGANGFLNQRCALTPDLESILRTQTGKILLQQNRHEAADHILICEGRFRGEADKQGRVASTAWVEDDPGCSLIPGLGS